jgi:hypothetical protein
MKEKMIKYSAVVELCGTPLTPRSLPLNRYAGSCQMKGVARRRYAVQFEYVKKRRRTQ